MPTAAQLIAILQLLPGHTPVLVRSRSGTLECTEADVLRTRGVCVNMEAGAWEVHPSGNVDGWLAHPEAYDGVPREVLLFAPADDEEK